MSSQLPELLFVQFTLTTSGVLNRQIDAMNTSVGLGESCAAGCVGPVT